MGTVALLVIGVGLYVGSPPEKGTVEWHKREYFKAEKKLMGRTWFTPVEKFYCKITDREWKCRPLSPDEVDRCVERTINTWTSLLNMGYLDVRRFTITNATRGQIPTRIWRERAGELSKDEEAFTKFSYPETEPNMLVIEGVAKHMAKWEEAVRKADVP